MVRSLPTIYNGIRFRSRLEADWARALDGKGVVWTYEPETWAFGPDLCYLPDLYLPALTTFVEVKGILDSRSEQKVNALREVADINGIMVVLAYAPAGERWERVRADGRELHSGMDQCPQCNAWQFFDEGGCRVEECRRNNAPRPLAECETTEQKVQWCRWWAQEMARAGRVNDAARFLAESLRVQGMV